MRNRITILLLFLVLWSLVGTSGFIYYYIQNETLQNRISVLEVGEEEREKEFKILEEYYEDYANHIEDESKIIKHESNGSTHVYSIDDY